MERPIRGYPPQPIDTFWTEFGLDRLKKTIESLENAAKQLVSIVAFSQTVYFAGISFADLKKGLVHSLGWGKWLIVIAALSPIVCWILSLYWAIRVFKPEEFKVAPDAPDEARALFIRLRNYKAPRLLWSYRALLVGFICLGVILFLYLGFFPQPP